MPLVGRWKQKLTSQPALVFGITALLFTSFAVYLQPGLGRCYSSCAGCSFTDITNSTLLSWRNTGGYCRRASQGRVGSARQSTDLGSGRGTADQRRCVGAARSKEVLSAHMLASKGHVSLTSSQLARATVLPCESKRKSTAVTAVHR